MANDPTELHAIGEAALAYISDGMLLGLGTGAAATAFIHALGARVKAGLNVRGVPTSQTSADLANQLGIPLTTLDEVGTLDIAVDGADEVDPAGNLIKGYGGALVREKIVASSARKFIVLVGPEKIVARLGERGRVPVEIVPFAAAATARRLPGCEVRVKDGKPVFSDNGNFLYDCRVGPLDDPAAFERELEKVPGVVDTGLFLGFEPVVLIGRGDRVETRDYSEKRP